MTPYDYIKKEIILGNFEAGSVFDEAKITEKLNVSRTPIREAVLRLANEGYLTIIPRKGTLVSNISIKDIKEVYEARIIIECGSIKTMTNMNNDVLYKWKAYFNNLLEKDTKANEEEELNDIDKAFHLDISRFLSNKIIEKEVELLMDKSARIRYSSNKNNKERYIESINEHLNIIDSLLAADLDSAEKLMKEHLLCSLRGYNL